MSVTFSDSLVKEYQAEMLATYGVLVTKDEAQIQLRTLIRTMFPTQTIQSDDIGLLQV